jgi:hypothetical protein
MEKYKGITTFDLVKLTDRTESRNSYEEKRRCLLSIEMLNARRSKKITQER